MTITDEQWTAVALLFGEPELPDKKMRSYELRWASAAELTRFDAAVLAVLPIDKQNYTLQDLRNIFDAYRHWLRTSRNAQRQHQEEQRVARDL